MPTLFRIDLVVTRSLLLYSAFKVYPSTLVSSFALYRGTASIFKGAYMNPQDIPDLETYEDEYSPHLKRIERLAHLFDNRFSIPGTNIRFGWDGLIGLLPGVDSPGGKAALLVVAHTIPVQPPALARRR